MVHYKVNMAETLQIAPILGTKLHIPQAAAKTVERSRLIEQINSGLEGKITYLSAPAGFGKSTLLEHWARQAPAPPAWYSIDQGDNDPVRFWQYVAAAVDKVRPGFAEAAGDAIKLIGPGQCEVAIAMIINELQLPEQPLVLVLDDFHMITDESLLASIVYFIEYLPKQVHLIVSSRTEPAFKSARLISMQWLTRLDTADLRFTPQEAREFYANCMELELSTQEANAWMQRTEGWIAAMKLAGLSLRGTAQRSFELLRKFTGSSRLMEQYLWEEVFMQQSEQMRRFLMDCSVLNRMNASLCRYLTGSEQAQEMLEQLENEQLLMIRLDEHQNWYRFHHLFTDFLQARLKKLDPERISNLLERAGEWCECEGLREEALEYYMNAQHYERAIGLIEKITVTSAKFMRVSPVWLSTQFSRIPKQILMQRPYLYFSYVRLVMMDEGNHARADKMIRYAEQAFESALDHWTEEAGNEFRGSLYFMKMLYALFVARDQEQAIQYIRLSRQYAPASRALIFVQTPTAGHPSFLREHMKQDDRLHGRAFILPFLNQLIVILKEIDMVVTLQTCLAEAHYEFDELDQAERMVEEALASAFTGDPSVLPEALFAARLLLTRIHRANGRRDMAVKTMRATRRDIIELGISRSLIYCEAELALMAMEQGDQEPAAAWLKLYRLSGSDDIDNGQLYEYEYLTRIYAATGRYEEALKLGERLRLAASRADRYYSEMELAVLCVILLHRTGRTEEALARLPALLFAMEQHDFTRTILDAGEPMGELLSLFLSSRNNGQWEEGPTLGYVRSLLYGFGRNVEAVDDLSLILTNKEIEVFGLIAKRRTNNEIAAALGVSYGTVRTHIKNIYSKLTVTTRPEAIRKAEEFGL